MSAIEASSVQCKTMADGTLRLSVDIEPRHARDAFALFGTPGTPMALAALKTSAQQESEPAQQPPAARPEAAKGGALAKLAGMWCQSTAFASWLSRTYTDTWAVTSVTQPDSERCADVVRVLCGIDSRAELDHYAEAADLFQRHIRGPYMKHIGVAA